MGEQTSEAEAQHATRNGLFALLLLLSGFCGISYEVLYGRILGSILGDQFVVSASILLTFLLGIGFGTLYAHRLWRYLWMIEACIGAFGVLFAFGSPVLERLLYTTAPVLGAGLGSSVLLCFLLLLPPAFVIGCSLPLFAGYLARLRPGRVFARAYTIYNLGAALTVLAIEFALLRALGLRFAILSIAALNGCVALAVLLGYGRLRSAPPAPADAARYPVRWLTALAVASLASAVFQLLMLKIAECLLGPFRETFAFVLALVLLGIAAGSLITEKARLSFSTVVTAAAASVLWLLLGFSWLARLYARFYETAVGAPYPTIVAYKLAALAMLMGVPAMAFGATIPALLSYQRNVARESGQLLFVSSLANAAGFLLMVFVLHQHLAYGTIVLCVLGLAALAVAIHAGWKSRRAVAAGGLLLAAGVVHATLWDETLLYVGYSAFQAPAALTAAREKLESVSWFKGRQDLFAINRSDGEPWFFINGYMSMTLDSPNEKLVGAFPATFVPRTDRALVLGLGSGATGGAVGLLFDRTDAVEIVPVVIENLFRMKDYNFDIENMRGVQIFQDDAIHFVKTHDETYSLIVNTVTTPLYFSSSKLYTRDFLTRVKDRLTPDGVYVTWMDQRVGDRGAAIILKTLAEEFDHLAVCPITGAYMVTLCSNEEIRLRQPHLVRDNPTLHRYFEIERGLPSAWIPYGFGVTDIHGFVEDSSVPANTLDYPVLEFEMARLRHKGYGAFMKALVEQGLSLDRSAERLAAMDRWDPIHLLLYNELLIGRNRVITQQWSRLVEQQVPDHRRRYAEALVAYHATRVRDADTLENRLDLAMALMQAGRHAEAVETLQTTLKHYPRSERVHFMLAAAYERQGHEERAIAEYGKVLALNRNRHDAHGRRGALYLKLLKPAEALREFTRALELRDMPSYHRGRGVALRALGDEAGARRAFEQAQSSATSRGTSP